MDHSLRYQSSMPDNFTIQDKYLGPNDEPCATQLVVVHPLKESESKYDQHKLDLQLHTLRKTSGLAAPLKLTMEIQATQKVGHLPFLPSRKVAYESLTGLDEFIEFSDFLGTTNFDEVYKQPHAVMERHLNIL